MFKRELFLVRLVLIVALPLLAVGCGDPRDNVTDEEARTLRRSLSYGTEMLAADQVIDRLEGKTVSDRVKLFRVMYHLRSDSRPKEVVYKMEDGKIVADAFNPYGNDWRNHVEDLMNTPWPNGFKDHGPKLPKGMPKFP
ncbi:MAG: hypothetical protein U0793_32200 [Gemmataceae bacterium]